MIFINYLFQLSAIIIIQKNSIFIQSVDAHPNVLELDDRIIEYANQGGKWLIEFYAPWCGHCKKLEPVYEEVGKHFSNSNINVVKVDATKYTRSASNFEVKGYPTIKFVSMSIAYTFNGDRKAVDIIDFVDKADGPRIRKIASKADLKNAKLKKILFLFISQTENDNSTLKATFQSSVDRHFLDSYFFSCSKPEVLPKDIDITELPAIVVIKEETNFRFNPEINSENLNNDLELFIKNDRFLTFSPVSITNFHNLIESRKIILILLTDPSNLVETKKLKQIFKLYSESNHQLRKDFQFGYTDTTDLLNNVAIWSLDGPLLFILNSTNYKFSLIHFDRANLPGKNEIDAVIQDIRDMKLEFHGGDGWLRNFRRPFWELYRGIIEMFVEAPFISLLIFGIPFAVISIVCYFLCCFEGTETTELDELSEDSELGDELMENFDEEQHMIEENNIMSNEELKKTN